MSENAKILKLIEDSVWFSSQVVEDVDQATNEKRMRVIAQVQEADVVNKNNRVYPFDVLQEAVEDLKERIKKGRVFGNVDHPEAATLKDASHLVKNVWWAKDEQGNPTKKLMAEMVILNTPTGNIVKEILKAGGRPGFSSRGYGNTEPYEMEEEDGSRRRVERVTKGFKLESFDFVIDPSVDSAVIHKIIESASATGNKIEEEEKMPEIREDLKEKLVLLEEALRRKEKAFDQQSAIISGIVKILRENGILVENVVQSAEDEEKHEMAQDLAAAVELLERAKERLTKLQEEKVRLEEKLRKAEVHNYIFELTEGEMFGRVFRKRLLEKKLTSKEEVDKEFSSLRELMSFMQDDEALKVKGTSGKGFRKPIDEGFRLGEEEKLDEELRTRLKSLAKIGTN